MDTLFVVTSTIVGVAVGSFLNVAILRLPAGESIVVPASHCPRCKTPLRWYHNIPLLSWIALRGRCGFCAEPIGWQYPLVEVATGLVWGVNASILGPTLDAVLAIVLLTILLGIAVADARFYIIPDEFSIGGLVVGLGLAAAGTWVWVSTGPTLGEALLGALVGGGVLWIVAIGGTWAFKKEAMGGGDIKMLAMVGAFLGWKGALLTIFLGALVGTAVFVPIAVRSDKLVPFGVFLAVGAAVTFYMGEPLLEWYLGTLR